MAKAHPPTVDFDPEEGAALLAGEPATLVGLRSERTWKSAFINPFGDCSLHDLSWCCLAQWVPCAPFAITGRRALKLNIWLQALLYVALFGGIARVTNVVVEKECPMWTVNPEWVALHGQPDFPPPPALMAFHPHGPPHHGGHHRGGPHDGHHEHPKEFAFVAEIFSKHEAEEPKKASVPMVSLNKAEDTAPEAPKKPAMPLAALAEKLRTKVPTLEGSTQEEKKSILYKKIKSGFEAGAMAKLAEMKERMAKRAERRSLLRGAPKPEDGEVMPYLINEKCKSWHLLSIVGLVATILGALYAGNRRTQMRERFGIPGSRLADFCAWLWCPCCAVAQEARTMSHNGVQDGEWPEPVAEAEQVLVAPEAVYVVKA